MAREYHKEDLYRIRSPEKDASMSARGPPTPGTPDGCGAGRALTDRGAHGDAATTGGSTGLELAGKEAVCL